MTHAGHLQITKEIFVREETYYQNQIHIQIFTFILALWKGEKLKLEKGCWVIVWIEEHLWRQIMLFWIACSTAILILQLLLKTTQPRQFNNCMNTSSQFRQLLYMLLKDKKTHRKNTKPAILGLWFRVLKQEMKRGSPNLGSSSVMRKQAETMVSPPSFKGIHTGPILILQAHQCSP